METKPNLQDLSQAENKRRWNATVHLWGGVSEGQYKHLRSVGMDRLAKGYRICGQKFGAVRRPPVRDPASGRIDPVATAAAYDLWEAEEDATEALRLALTVQELRAVGGQ